MPFKSQAQRRKFAEMMVRGEISPETFEEWNRETGSARLPERVGGTKKGVAKKGVKKAVKKAVKRKVAKRVIKKAVKKAAKRR